MIKENWDSLTPQQIVQRAVACADRVVDLYSGLVDNCNDIRDAINVARRFIDGDSSVSSKEARCAAIKAREASQATLDDIESFNAGMAAYRTALSAEAAISVAEFERRDVVAGYNPVNQLRRDSIKFAQHACEVASQAES